MVYSDTGALPGCLQLGPREWRLVHVEAPHVIHGFGAGVASKGEQVGLRKDDSVAVPAARCVPDHRHYHPLGLLVAVPQIK